MEKSDSTTQSDPKTADLKYQRWQKLRMAYNTEVFTWAKLQKLFGISHIWQRRRNAKYSPVVIRTL